MSTSLENGLIVLGLAADAPFLPKLVQAYLPLVLPHLLDGVSVKAWDIAKSLIALMLVPLALGLLWRSHSPQEAANWQPTFAKVSTVALLTLPTAKALGGHGAGRATAHRSAA